MTRSADAANRRRGLALVVIATAQRLTGQAFILCFACISLMWSAASCRMMTG